MDNYEDIINLEHHISSKHPRMSIRDRSAQFAPFSALNGYDNAVKETARITDNRIEIDEEIKKMLNEKLINIKNQIKQKPKVTFMYFIPDLKKNGGQYVEASGNVKKIDEYEDKIILEDGNEILINDIIDINY